VGGFLELFDGGMDDYTLYLHYFLPFTGQDGKMYHLGGTKYIYGNSCIDLWDMATTLYTEIRTGNVFKQGQIVDTGIVYINELGVLELVLSFGGVGNGTDADFLAAIVEFGGFLWQNIDSDCLNISAYEADFWYIWGSDGKQGFLLDLIKRPDELEIRLDLYDITPGVAPTVIKQYYPLSHFNESDNGVTVGPFTLTQNSCVGTVNGINVNINFQLSGRENNFVPEFIEDRLPILPNVTSRYGALTKGTCNGTNYAGIPLVYTSYPVPIGMGWWEWAMVSAMKFQNTDLQIELVATQLTYIWVATSYVYYKGQEYHYNDPFLLDTEMGDKGDIKNGNRVFSATIYKDFQIHFDITCSAPVDKFALLETEGLTQIHTTLLGSCKATDVNAGVSYVADGALLEAKSRIL